jgi:hypothetical protein
MTSTLEQKTHGQGELHKDFGAYNQNFRLVSKQPPGDVELSSKRKVQLEATANSCDNMIDA